MNLLIRVLIKKANKLNLFWPVSGVIDCRFSNLSFKLYSKCDDHQVDYFYYDVAFHEHKVLKIIIAFAKSSKCILDIGANTGLHSIIAAKANPRAKIFSIEPYWPNYTRLQKNLGINGCTNIEVFKVAIGNSAGTLSLYVPEKDKITDVSSAIYGFGKRIYPEIEWKEIEIEQWNLDMVFEKTGKIDFFKCDVEGFEDQVLKGGANFFNYNTPPFVMEISIDIEKCNYFNFFIKQYGYVIYYVGDDGLTMLDSLYNFSNCSNFIFTRYRHSENYIPFNQIDDFVDKCRMFD